jgi:hypothetical protein
MASVALVKEELWDSSQTQRFQIEFGITGWCPGENMVGGRGNSELPLEVNCVEKLNYQVSSWLLWTVGQVSWISLITSSPLEDRGVSCHALVI